MQPAKILVAAAAVSLALVSSSFAQGTLTGQIASVDEHAGTITIKQQDGRSEAFKAQDGLLFNAVRPGDTVMFTTGQVNGETRITSLQRQ